LSRLSVRERRASTLKAVTSGKLDVLEAVEAPSLNGGTSEEAILFAFGCFDVNLLPLALHL